MLPDSSTPTRDDATHVVRTALTALYGTPVIAHGDDGRVMVLPGKPLTAAREALDAAGLAPGLVAPINLETVSWSLVPEGGIDLWRTHGAHDELVTQLLVGDPAVQVVGEHEGWQLVRCIDGATGWVEARSWEGVNGTPATGEARDVRRTDFVAAACSLLDVPYRWGGTTAAGVDCSGLVQRSAWDSSRVWLPRHSTHLLRVGDRVAPRAARNGDVLVLRRRPHAAKPTQLPPGMPDRDRGPLGTTMHVGIVLGEDGADVVHASLDAFRVVIEPRNELLARYTVLGARRLGGQA